MDKEKLSNKLDEVFNESNLKIIAPRKFLTFVEDVLVDQYEKLVEAINKKSTVDILPLLNELKENKELLEKLLAKDIIFPEQKDIVFPEFPKEVDIKKPEWYKDFPLEEIKKYIQGIKIPQFNGKKESAPFYLNGDGLVIPGVEGKSIYVYALKLITSQDMTVNWRDGLDYDIEGPQSYVANGGYTESILPPGCLFSLKEGNGLSLIISINKKQGYASGRVSYWIE